MKIRVTLIFSMLGLGACGQPIKDFSTGEKELFINPSVINQDNPEVVEVLNVWKNYLSTKDSLYEENLYWSENELRKRKLPDYFFKNINHSILFDRKNFYKPTILSVKKDKKDYIIQTLFANAEKDNGFSRISGIIKIEVTQEKGVWKLKSMLERNLKENYLRRKVNSINYYYPRYRHIDMALCRKFDQFNKAIAAKFRTIPLLVTYYLCTDNTELQRLKGFDYEVSMAYPNQTSGLADIFNNAIYAGNNSEWYPHELVHLYTHNKRAGTIHECFDEGVATLFGGSVGKPLEYHLRKSAIYVKTHSIDFVKLPSLERIDDETNFQYAIGGLICQLVLKQQGMFGIEKLLQCPDDDNAFFKTVEDVLKVKRENFNIFIHMKLEKYAK